MSPVAGSVSSPPLRSLKAMPPGSSRAGAAAVAEGTSLTRNSATAAKPDVAAKTTAVRARTARMEIVPFGRLLRDAGTANPSVNPLRTPGVIGVDAARAPGRARVVPPRDNCLERIAVRRRLRALRLLARRGVARLLVPAGRLRVRAEPGALLGRIETVVPV